MKFSLVLALAVALVATAAADSKAAPSLLRKLESGARLNVKLSLTHGESTRALLDQIKTRTYANRAARLNGVKHHLKSKVDEYQKDLLAFLAREKSADVDVRPLWVSNKIILRNVDYATVQKLMSHPDVSLIQEERIFKLHPIEEETGEVFEPRGPLADAQWGVARVLAPSVWETGNRGDGIVVSTVDSGVSGNHEALKDNHREEFGWMDPGKRTAKPTDTGGHGTHTMGSIAGTANGIGVAPGAKWIACRGCPSDCPEFDLEECGQWIACPFDYDGNEDCSQAPHLVSNSWGGGQGDPFYDDVIAVWRANGIHPFFSIGNSGAQGCGSANSPGDSPDVIGVGAINNQDHTSTFSSLGPTVDKRRKPDITAPGSAIISASHRSVTGYVSMSGTSMSCPHAAGLAALLLSQYDGELSYDQVKSLLESGAVPHKAQGRVVCGGIANTVWPNNHVGHGIINGVNTVLNQTLISPFRM